MGLSEASSFGHFHGEIYDLGAFEDSIRVRKRAQRSKKSLKRTLEVLRPSIADLVKFENRTRTLTVTFTVKDLVCTRVSVSDLQREGQASLRSYGSRSGK